MRTLARVKSRADEYNRMRLLTAESNRNPMDRDVIGGELARLMIEMRDTDIAHLDKIK